MPRRKAAASESTTKNEKTSVPTRRSTRSSSKPQQSQPDLPEPATRKRKADIASTERNDEDDGRKKKKKKKVKSPEPINADDDDDETPIITIGDYLPVDMKLKNEQGQDILLGDLSLGSDDIHDLKGIVIFCVPKADTPGCTTQACGFRDSYPKFSTAGFQVYGLSADKPPVHARWKTKKSLPYPLLSDPNRELISALGVGRQQGKTQRSHFVFSKEDAKLKLIDKRAPVKPADSPKLALEFIKGFALEDDEEDES